MSGRRRRAPDRFVLAAMASAVGHAVLLAAALLWFGRAPPRSPAAEQGVEIVWDDTSGETVGEAPNEAAAPGAPPSPSAPEAVEAPVAPRMAEAPPTPVPEPAEAPPPPPQPPSPPAPPAPPPAMPSLAELPPAPAALPDLPPMEAPEPDMAALPPVPEAAPAGEAELPLPPPAPPLPSPPPAPRAEPRPPAQAARRGGEEAVRGASGIGRATGAVVPPGLDTSFRNAAPAYPEASRLRGEQGAVGLELSIDAQGRVLSAVVARSSGSPALDAAARSAVLAWRFRPARVDGQPVPGAIRTTVHFRLS